MEKRFVSFLLASLVVLLGYSLLVQLIFGPPRPPAGGEAVVEAPAEPGEKPVEVVEGGQKPPADPSGGQEMAAAADREEPPRAIDSPPPRATEADVAAEILPQPSRLVALGSLDPKSEYEMLVFFTSAGGAIERLELNNPRFTELEDKTGYLGYVAASDSPQGGCLVRVVGPGTPAARAEPDQPAAATGLRGPAYEVDADGRTTVRHAGDRIVEINGEPVGGVDEFHERMKVTRPGQTIQLTVYRADENGDEIKLTFRTTLVKRPLAVLSCAPQWSAEEDSPPPPSFLWTLASIDDHRLKLGQDELEGIPSLLSENWSVRLLPAEDDSLGPAVEFRQRLTPAQLQALDVDATLEFVKRFRLGTRRGEDVDGLDAAGYRIGMELEIENKSESTQTVAYQLDGPSGLTIEGWWYSYKVHPTSFKGAGARDVGWRADGDKHKLYVCSEITNKASKEPKTPDTPLIEAREPFPLRYAGTDAQYFCTVLLADGGVAGTEGTWQSAGYLFEDAVARATGPLDTERKKRTNVSFRLTSQQFQIAPGKEGALRQRFTIYAGPKQAEILAKYDLEPFIVYGWFGVVSKPMLAILHFFYAWVGSFGIAIILLTVLVRGCMFPLGRKMAMNAQKMQELAPEMKKIADKYKNDMEKRSQAQRELFQKHSYNPFAGCLVMFIQLPIFIGLYRSLSVDIALRQAPLIPGLSWCSNLAGPDKFLYWENMIPGFLSDPTGWLGPYLNLLPLITVALFIVQQKMFTPPPQDETQQMQQQVMKFMMVFMGVLFHKIAAGLCVYFIASSLWGLAERKLLPKTKRPPEDAAEPVTVPAVSGNGADAQKKRKKRRQRRR